MISHSHAVDKDNYKQIFQCRNGKPLVNKAFSGIKKEWNWRSIENGHCPFILNQYKKVRFVCNALNKHTDVEIEGLTELIRNTNNDWAFRFKIRYR